MHVTTFVPLRTCIELYVSAEESTKKSPYDAQTVCKKQTYANFCFCLTKKVILLCKDKPLTLVMDRTCKATTPINKLEKFVN